MAFFPKPAEGSWTEHWPELGTAPVNYNDSIDPEHYKLEQQAIFRKTWLKVGRVEQLPKTGSYFTREMPSAGSLATSLPDFLVSTGSARLSAFRLMFYAYAALGVLSAALYRRVPRAHAAEQAPHAPLGPSRGTVYKLAALFSIDAFAGGFIAQSLLVLWLFERFDLSLTAASGFFFWSNVLSAFSYPVAARLGNRFGLVNTMVFTHIPSSICLIAAAFTSSLPVALGLLLLRSAFSQMDVPTRTSFVMAVVTPPERTAAASMTAVPRSLASSISPAISGALLSTSFLGLPLVLCGVLKIVYDLSLLFAFRHLKPPEERV